MPSRPIDALVRSDRILVIGAPTTRVRPRWISIETIKKDMAFSNVIEEMALNRYEWGKRIHAADSKSLG